MHHELYREESVPPEKSALEDGATKVETIAMVMPEDIAQTPIILDYYLTAVQDWMDAAARSLVQAHTHMDHDLREKDRVNEGMSSRLISQLMDLGSSLDAERRTVRELQCRLQETERSKMIAISSKTGTTPVGGGTGLGFAMAIEGHTQELQAQNLASRVSALSQPVKHEEFLTERPTPKDNQTLNELADMASSLRSCMDVVVRYYEDSRAIMRRVQDSINSSDKGRDLGGDRVWELKSTGELKDTPRVVDDFVRNLIEKLTAVTMVISEQKREEVNASDIATHQSEMELSILKKKNKILEAELIKAREMTLDEPEMASLKMEVRDQRWRLLQHKSRDLRVQRSIERYAADAKSIGSALLSTIDKMIRSVPSVTYVPFVATIVDPIKPLDTFLTDIHLWLGDTLKSLRIDEPKHEKLMSHILKTYMGAAGAWVTASTSTLGLASKDLNDKDFLQSELMIRTLDKTLSEERLQMISHLAEDKIDNMDTKPWRRRKHRVNVNSVLKKENERVANNITKTASITVSSIDNINGNGHGNDVSYALQIAALRAGEEDLRSLLHDLVEDTNGLLHQMGKDRRMFLEELQEQLNMGTSAGNEGPWRAKISELTTADTTLHERGIEFRNDNSKTLLAYFPIVQYWMTDAVKLMRVIASSSTGGGGILADDGTRAMIISKTSLTTPVSAVPLSVQSNMKKQGSTATLPQAALATGFQPTPPAMRGSIHGTGPRSSLLYSTKEPGQISRNGSYASSDTSRDGNNGRPPVTRPSVSGTRPNASSILAQNPSPEKRRKSKLKNAPIASSGGSPGFETVLDAFDENS